ncbi:MAG: transporter substrate-binding domain-containing protein [Pseudomonadota bacterium]
MRVSIKLADTMTPGIFFIVVLLLPSLSFGEELLMVTFEHAPHHYTENGNVTGGCTDMLRQILTGMGHKPVFRSMPWMRAQEMLNRGDADGIYVYTQTRERLQTAYYSNPVSYITLTLFKRRCDAIQWNTLSDIRPYRVGASGGYHYPDTFLKAAENGDFTLDYVFNNTPNLRNLRKLVAKRIDLFICNPEVCGIIMKKYAPEFDDLDYIDKNVAPPMSLHVGFSKKLTNGRQIRDEFNKKFDEFLSSGQLKHIYDKYGMKPDYEKLGSKGIAISTEGRDWQ